MTLPISVRMGFVIGKSCVYCGAPATDVDHIRPRSRGGTDDDSNLTSACHPCNMSKNSLLITEWQDRARVLHAVAVEPKVYAELRELVTYGALPGPHAVRGHGYQGRGLPPPRLCARPRPPGRRTLREVSSDLGTAIVPMGYENLRKTRQRAQKRGELFPEGVDGTYTDDEIRAWFEASGREPEQAKKEA